MRRLLSLHRAPSHLLHSQRRLLHSALLRSNRRSRQKKASSAGSRVCLQQSQPHPSSLYPLLGQKPLKAARPATAATVTATAAVASPVKAAPMVKAATRPPVKAVAHAVKAVVTDAIAAADAVDVAAAAVLIAKVVHSANVLTPKANPCLWTPTCSPVAKPQAVPMAIGRNNALNALPASVVNAAAVVDVPVSAMKPVNASNNRAQKAVPMLQ